MTSKSINQQLATSRIVIDNTLSNPEIEKKLSLVGYPRKKVLEGKTLYENTVQLQQDLEDKYGLKNGATDNFHKDLQGALVLYRRHRKLAKVAYENNRQKLKTLKLDGTIPTRIENWLSHAIKFYKVLAKDSNTVGQFGIFTEELAQAQAMTEALLAARNWQVATKGEAQRATQQRNQSLKALNAWMKEFRMAVRYALREDEQLLEVLGLVVKTSK